MKRSHLRVGEELRARRADVVLRRDDDKGLFQRICPPVHMICRSSIASSSADCVLLEVRFISSPRSRLACVAAPS